MAERADGRRSWSVRVRILAAILAVAAIGLAVAGGTAYLVERAQTLQSLDDRLLDRVEAARTVVSAASGAVPSADPEPSEDVATAPETTDASISSTRAALDAIFRAVIPGGGESAVGIIDGVATVVPGVALDFRLDSDPAFVALATSEAASGDVRIGVAELSDRTVRFVAAPVDVADDSARGVYVAAIDQDAELRVIESTFQVYALVALATLATMAIVGWFVAGRLLRPLRTLRETASRITETESADRIPVSGHDDVSQLTSTVNGMLDRLAESSRGQRRLLDDVRHELKTPITIVRGHLELLDPGRADDVEATRALAIDELDRMAELVDALATLEEVSRDAITAAPVDVDALTRDVHAKVSVIPGHEWVLDAAASGIALLDRARLTQAWLQLADNAAKYAPARTNIGVGSAVIGDELELWVRDRGPGIPDGFESRIFERFGRADTGNAQGFGLGLPIVQAIAHAHGGRVVVQSSPAGSRFALLIPLVLAGATERTLP